MGLLLVVVLGLLIAVVPWLWDPGSKAQGLQQLQVSGSRAQSQQLWLMSLVAPWHMGSSRIQDQTRVSCIGRWILYHRATWKPLDYIFQNIGGLFLNSGLVQVI